MVAAARPAAPGDDDVRPSVPGLRTRLRRTFAGRCAASFVAVQGLDRAMSIASQSFTALIPLLVLLSAALPAGGGDAVADSVVRRFALTGEGADAVRMVFDRPQPGTVGVGSLLLLVLSGVSLTRRLQRMYVEVYGLPPLSGVRGSLNAAMALGGLLVEISLLYLLRSLVRVLPFEWALGAPLSLLASLVLWTSIPFLLLDRRIPWQRLLPAGVLAGTAVGLYGIATTLYMPQVMTSYSARYGLFGVTVALVGWLLCTAVIVVAATVVAAELDRAPEPWARRLRARLGGDRPSRPGATAPADDG